ncbi:MAG TPA: tetratricopeptide repeat protein, partial [Polyangia bacterium]|nr:tetratricopeptide repeat protein [Polyangia bacterium]
PPAPKAEPARGLRLDFVDLPGEEPAPESNVDPSAPRAAFTSLSVGVGVGVGVRMTAGTGRTVSEPPPAAASRPRSATSLGLGPAPLTLGTAEDVPFDGGLSLELVERKPTKEAKHGKEIKAAKEKEAALSPRLDAPTARSLDSGPGLETRANQPIMERAAPGTVAVSAPSPDTESAPASGASPTAPKPRPRTMTAARPGANGDAEPTTFSRRRLIAIGGVAAIAAAIAVALALDVPARLRPEPNRATVLGPLFDQLAQDRFSAYAEASRRLEDAVASRKRAPATRAEAASLLAASVVIHGGERGRLAQAEALLAADEPPGAAVEPGKQRPERLRARAWLALGKSRFKEAEELAAAAPMANGDRLVITGWVALGRRDFAAAETAFAGAAALSAGAAPSKVATTFALGLAREGQLSAAAENTYRALLAEAPAHVGAALGLLRTSHLTPPARLKLAQTLLSTQAKDASRFELAEAHVRVAEALRETGDRAGSDAALARARQADPSNPALAIALAEAALRDGRKDEAIAHAKLAIAASAASARTPAFRFAEVATLLAAGRTADAGAILGPLEKPLPRDPRVPYWRAQLAEAATPPALSTAEQAYGEALTRDPAFVPASLALARLRLDHKRTQEALVVLKGAEAQGAPSVALRMALGEALLAAGNGAEAERAFRQVLNDDAKNASAHLGLAGALLTLGNSSGATAELTALAARADTTPLAARIAELLLKVGRREEALASYRKQVAAGSATAATKVAAARLALELDHKDVAQTLAEAATEEDPRTPGALFVLAEVLREKGDLSRAISELRRAQAVDGSPEVQLAAGRLLALVGRDEEAMTALADVGPIPEASIERARIHLRRGNAERAAEELTGATAKLPSNAEAFALLGQAEDRLGHVDKAETAFKTAARLQPTLGEVRYRLGRLLLDRGAAAAALPHLRAAAEHTPAAATWRADLYFQLGFAEQRQGSRERTQAAFRRYLELAPPDAPARAEVLKQLGDSASPL